MNIPPILYSGKFLKTAALSMNREECVKLNSKRLMLHLSHLVKVTVTENISLIGVEADAYARHGIAYYPKLTSMVLLLPQRLLIFTAIVPSGAIFLSSTMTILKLIAHRTFFSPHRMSKISSKRKTIF